MESLLSTNTIYSDRMKTKVDLYNRKIITAFFVLVKIRSVTFIVVCSR